MQLQPHEYPYEKISSLKQGMYANFYGQVVEFEPPKPTRGTDMLLTVFVVDETIESTFSQRGALLVQIFKRDLSEFPDIRKTGEIVQFRHFKILSYGNRLQALSTKSSRYVVFSKESEKEGKWLSRPSAHQTHSEEFEAIKRIVDGYREASSTITANPLSSLSSSKNTRELMSIHSLKPNIYFNIVVEVLKNISTDHGVGIHDSPDQVYILATDYTKNNSIQLNPDNYGLFPFEEYANMLLHCTFWDNFANVALKLRPGDIVHLENMHSRFLDSFNPPFSSSSSPFPSLSGIVAVMHGDQSHIGNSVMNKSSINNNMTREQIKKISMDSDPSLIRPLLQRREKFKNQVQAKMDAISIGTLNPTRIEWNYNVITPIETIKTFPEENNKFLIKCRVIDHSPKKFEDFSRLCCPKCFTTIPDGSKSKKCSKCSSSASFIFIFSLIVDDGTDEIPIILCFEDAIKFFNGIMPVNLSIYPDILSYIKNNIEALEQSPIPSLFCIKSYKVVNQVTGESEMRYRVFDTILNQVVV